jgi:MGT family glycosyltransferase
MHVDAALRRLRRAHGFRGGASEAARFTLFPALLEDPAHPGPPDTLRFREPAAPSEDDGDPLIYLTFGSVAPQRDDVFPALYRAAIDALAALDTPVLVTIGRDRDPAALGPVPAHVRVERWVPQARVMGRTRVVVSHGGSGTLRAGLAAGIPQVVLPLFADQPYNAARVQALGAGIAAKDASDVAAAARAILTDPAYAERAATVAADIRALPPVAAAAAHLRELAEVREAA